MIRMSFYQDPPRLENQYRDDRVLRSYLGRVLPEEVLEEIEPSLERMGEMAAGRLFELSSESRLDEPRHVPFDAWGRRVDEIRVPPAWKEFARVAAEEGLVATAHEARHGQWSRLHQFALVYLFDRSSAVYNCPLAMTDGAVRTLKRLGTPELRDRIVPRLLSRDPTQAWTSGQWMTERTGGSDVGTSETVACRSPEGWRLYGTKWFTSAATAEVALTLGRPEGNPAAGRGLAMFLVERRLPDGRSNGIRVLRLKEKLGTRMLPTAELELDGALAEPVGGLTDGVRNITTVLNTTRTWNAICSAAGLRRGVALARDYARRRAAFGAVLSQKPLHLETLAALQAESEAAFHLAFRAAELMGREDCGTLTEAEHCALRLLQPITKLLTAKQTVAGISEVLEAIGGAGYMEDTGLPVLLRDAQTLTIWEGTTNVLSLDGLRAISKEGALQPYLEMLRGHARKAAHPGLVPAAEKALAAAGRAEQWLPEAMQAGPAALEAGARRFAFTLGRSMQLALLCEQAQWDLDHHKDGRTAAAARRIAAEGVDFLRAPTAEMTEARALAMDEEFELPEDV
jgi:alkylation response protein AidB-like acyl-CoA dehydrogenase